jgi:hypothetical protein
VAGIKKMAAFALILDCLSPSTCLPIMSYLNDETIQEGNYRIGVKKIVDFIPKCQHVASADAANQWLQGFRNRWVSWFFSYLSTRCIDIYRLHFWTWLRLPESTWKLTRQFRARWPARAFGCLITSLPSGTT